MGEYIKKDDVLKEIESAGMWSRSYGELYEAVQNMQATDVAPVRHGRWLPYQTPIETRQSGWICNQCSGVAHDVSNGDTDYCPNCGARMDGDCHADD